MRKNILTSFRPTSLSYCSPLVDMTSPEPICFYNAFPDLNDVAPDGSRSAFPQRAKYLLPLDSIFQPSESWVNSNNIDEDYLVGLGYKNREIVADIIDKYGKQTHSKKALSLPRKPELDMKYRYESIFEITHKRLAATEYKWLLRTYFLASFYTTLEDHLERGQEIGVPLIPDASRRASQLQRHWKDTMGYFKPTVILDEAASLLVCVTLLPPEEWKAHEEAWVAHEETENRGFADVYRKLRARFNPESTSALTDKIALAEQITDYAKMGFSFRNTVGIVSSADEARSKLEWKNQRVVWPSLLGEEVHRGLRELRVRKDMALRHAAAGISIPEAMQWLMAYYSVVEEKERNRIHKGATWVIPWEMPITFSVESGDDSAYPRITLPSVYNRHLAALAATGIEKADGSHLFRNRTRGPVDSFLVDSICHYTFFLESIRQQLCTGVGLRCPLWKGSGCCAFRPLLQRTYEVCKPWHPVRMCHWQRPPCLT